jgi:hypothetical protein
MDKPETNEKPKKDWWDKIDIIGKGVIAIAALVVIPIVVARISGQVQKTITSQNTGKDYIGIALGILERKDLPEDMQKNIGLRQWAVRLLNHYSPQRLDDKTVQELINGETRLPALSDPLRPPTREQLEASPSHYVAELNPDKHFRVEVRGDGIMEVLDMQKYSSEGRSTDVTSPQGVVFASDSRHFAIYNHNTFRIFQLDIDEKKFFSGWAVLPCHIHGFFYQYPFLPAGVDSVVFGEDNKVIVRGPDRTETTYTFIDWKMPF